MDKLKLYRATLVIDTGVDHFNDVQIVFAEDATEALLILEAFVNKNYGGDIEHYGLQILPMERGVLSAPNKAYKVRKTVYR